MIQCQKLIIDDHAVMRASLSPKRGIFDPFDVFLIEINSSSGSQRAYVDKKALAMPLDQYSGQAILPSLHKFRHPEYDFGQARSINFVATIAAVDSVSYLALHQQATAVVSLWA
jgi:hypothetical protein